MRALRSIWAVARQTFTQALRSKVGGVFFVLLAGIVLVAVLLNSNPKVPLADRVRTFLSYSLGASSVLLCIVTVLLTTRIVSAEVEKKHVFILIVKPLAKWHYIVGRWLGVTLLDAGMLAVCGATIYGVASYMRTWEPTSAIDRRDLETAVFAARKKISPDFSKMHAQVEERVEARVREEKSTGRFQRAVESFLPRTRGNVSLAEEWVRNEFRKQEMEKHQSVKPGTSTYWVFKDIEVSGESEAGEGLVTAINRATGEIEVTAPAGLLPLMMREMPVTVSASGGKANVDARVVEEGHDRVRLRFGDPRILTDGALSSIGRQSHVTLKVDPVVQITYKPTALGETGDHPLNCWWLIRPAPPENAGETIAHFWELRIPHQDPSGLPATILVPARLVQNGRLLAVYLNDTLPVPNTTVSIEEADISLLYRVGSFEVNYLKGLALVLVQLMFVAALGVFAGSFLGFAVAAMMVFVLVVFALAQSYVQLSASSWDAPVLAPISRAVAAFLGYLVANLGEMSPAPSLVSGLAIDWSSVSATFKAGVSVAIILLLACLIYHKRELARVQV